jgi:hypothetical protein
LRLAGIAALPTCYVPFSLSVSGELVNLRNLL